MAFMIDGYGNETSFPSHRADSCSFYNFKRSLTKEHEGLEIKLSIDSNGVSGVTNKGEIIDIDFKFCPVCGCKLND